MTISASFQRELAVQWVLVEPDEESTYRAVAMMKFSKLDDELVETIKHPLSRNF